MDLTEAIQTFKHESAELLELMESALLRLELDPTEADLVNEVFRAAHTIQGSAGPFGFDAVVHFARHVESALERVPDGSLGIEPGAPNGEVGPSTRERSGPRFPGASALSPPAILDRIVHDRNVRIELCARMSEAVQDIQVPARNILFTDQASMDREVGGWC